MSPSSAKGLKRSQASAKRALLAVMRGMPASRGGRRRLRGASTPPMASTTRSASRRPKGSVWRSSWGMALGFLGSRTNAQKPGGKPQGGKLLLPFQHQAVESAPHGAAPQEGDL